MDRRFEPVGEHKLKTVPLRRFAQDDGRGVLRSRRSFPVAQTLACVLALLWVLMGQAFQPIAFAQSTSIGALPIVFSSSTGGSSSCSGDINARCSQVVGIGNVSSGVLAAAHGGAGSISGILKADGTGTVSAAASGTDYAPATSGSAILKGNGSGGFSNAAAGSDYLAPPSGTAIQKANSGGALANAVAGTDYAAAPSGGANTPLFNNGSGGFTNGTRSGNTTVVGTTSGILTSGDCVKFDASGNLIDNGSACGASGSQPIFTHSLSGATPTAAINSSSTPAIDVENFPLTANVTSITLPASSAIADGEDILVKIVQGSGSYTLPSGSAGTPFIAGSGTTIANLVPGGACPSQIGTSVNNEYVAVLHYKASLTEYEVLGCATNPAGVISVAAGGTGLGSGTSGGVLGFTGSGTLASSGALSQYSMLYGGGAGATPSATSTACNTDGSIPIGSSAGAPNCATITAGSNVTVTNAHNGITIAATGGGSSTLNGWQDPPGCYGNGTLAVGSANQVVLEAVTVPSFTVSNKLIQSIDVGDTTNSYDFAIYNNSGTELLSLGTSSAGVHIPTTQGVQWFTPHQTLPVTIPGGIIWLCFTGNATTATLQTCNNGGAGGLSDQLLYYNSNFATSSGGGCPASISVPTLSSAPTGAGNTHFIWGGF